MYTLLNINHIEFEGLVKFFIRFAGDGALLSLQERLRGRFHDRQRELRQQDRLLQRAVEVRFHL